MLFRLVSSHFYITAFYCKGRPKHSKYIEIAHLTSINFKVSFRGVCSYHLLTSLSCFFLKKEYLRTTAYRTARILPHHKRCIGLFRLKVLVHPAPPIFQLSRLLELTIRLNHLSLQVFGIRQICPNTHSNLSINAEALAPS